MESVTATVRGASAPLARARAALVCGRARLGPRRVVAAAGLAAPGRRRRALVAVASLQEPLPSRAQEAVAPQADEEGEVHGNGPAAAETSPPPAVPGKTVRVRFVLEKPCAFEQGVYLVGDDPALGLWDPVNAISLEWAESHGWILEKDLPANKLIEFKFLLPDSVGKLHWQNGPNRSFQTGETTNMLVIYEDWGDVKNQKIAEEERVPSVGMEEAVVSDGIEEGVVSDGIEEGVVSVGIEKGVVSDGKEEAIVVSDDSESGKGTVLEHELQMDDNREVKEYESVVAEEDEKSAGSINASVQVDSLETNEEASLQEPMLQKEPEIIDEPHEVVGMENSSAFCADENSAEKTEGENILSEDGVPVENGLAYEHDLLWGWKALQQLLLSLGSKMDTT